MTPLDQFISAINSATAIRKLFRIRYWYVILIGESILAFVIFVFMPLFVKPSIYFETWEFYFGMANIIANIGICLNLFGSVLFAKQNIYDGSHLFDNFNLKRGMKAWL